MTAAVRHSEGFPLDTIALAKRPFTRVEVFDSMEAAEPFWRALEAGDAVATPYQRFDFLKLWQTHVGSAEGVTPFIVVGFDAKGAPALLLPFGCRRFHGLRAIEFLGGKHCNFNVAVCRRDIAATISAADIQNVLAQLGTGADALLLTNQSLTWQGTTNPFALLPHQASPSMGFSGPLAPDFDALLRARTSGSTRKKIRKKEQALASFGPVHFSQVTDPDGIHRVLDVFFKQKNARMRARGISDAFSSAEVRRFIEAATAQTLADGKPVIELYALSVGDIVIATFGGMVGGGRFCGMFNSIIPDRFHAESPGEQLLVNLIRRCCERGLTNFDLGVGEASYKDMFCKDTEPLFDTYLPLSPAGTLLVAITRAKTAVKRRIKQNPLLWSALCMMRRWRARLSNNR